MFGKKKCKHVNWWNVASNVISDALHCGIVKYCYTNLAWLQSDDVGPGSLKRRVPPQVWMENIHLAEDTGLLVRDPGWVEVNGVLWRKEVPALPRHTKHRRVFLKNPFCPWKWITQLIKAFLHWFIIFPAHWSVEDYHSGQNKKIFFFFFNL